MEKTLSIIKPDATKRNITGSINAIIEKNGLKSITVLRNDKRFKSIENELRFKKFGSVN